MNRYNYQMNINKYQMNRNNKNRIEIFHLIKDQMIMKIKVKFNKDTIINIAMI